MAELPGKFFTLGMLRCFQVGNVEMLNCYYAHADTEEGQQVLLFLVFWLIETVQHFYALSVVYAMAVCPGSMHML